MSQIPYKPDPIAVDCAKKAGLPDWYVGDPMSAKPQVVLDPKREKDYADCYRNKIQPPKINSTKDKDLLNKQYQDALNEQRALNDANNSVSKYVFNQDFEATTRVEIQKAVGDYTENINYITLKYKFKKGDIFEGKKIPVNAGINTEAKKYDIQITTPKSIKLDGSDYVGQVTYQIDDNLVSQATFLQKNKTNLLIVGVLVLGYFAYKKFKK